MVGMSMESVQFGKATEILQKILRANNFSSLHILTDENTGSACLPRLDDLKFERKIHHLNFPAGEEFKTLATCTDVWRTLIAQSADRNSLLVSLGGGVVTDLGGFCAATFMRGMHFVHLPTSVLGMTDAAIGGKTGVDFDTYKNYIGSFAEPLAVIIDVGFLETLDNRQRRNGLAEILKHGFINDPELVDDIMTVGRIDDFEWERILKRSVLTKLKLIEGDKYDRGLRAALNFGHTVGHAIESFSMNTDNPLHHGEAIALGMLVEGRISNLVTGLPAADLAKLESAVNQYFPEIDFPVISINQLHEYVQRDKKKSGGDVLYSLISAMGVPELRQIVPETAVNEAYLHYAKR